jgi:hypothetical protein
VYLHVLLYLEQNGATFTGFSINPLLSKHLTEENSTTIGNGKGLLR